MINIKEQMQDMMREEVHQRALSKQGIIKKDDIVKVCTYQGLISRGFEPSLVLENVKDLSNWVRVRFFDGYTISIPEFHLKKIGRVTKWK